MRKFVTILAIIIAAQQVAVAQVGKVAAMRGKVENGYDFWIYAPEDYFVRTNDMFPLIIDLHGKTTCGKRLHPYTKYYSLEAIAMGRKVDAMVITPQNPGGSWKPERLNNVLEWVLDNYRVDPDSVYVMGMSLGGYGTMDFVGTYPEKIAAAMAMCGGSTLKDVQGLGQLPFWIIHGTADRAVSINASKTGVAALQQEGNDKLLRYDWIPGGSHGLLARVFYLSECYEWLLSHKRGATPEEVNRTIVIDNNVFSRTYRDLHTRKLTTIPEVKDFK